MAELFQLLMTSWNDIEEGSLSNDNNKKILKNIKKK